MNFALVYLIQRFFYRIFEFLRHWYIKSLFIYSHWVINFLERLDKIFALKVTLRHLFQPLYKDFSLIGYILGFLFRVMRVILAGSAYLIIVALALFFYVIWLLTPIYIVYKIVV